MCYLYTLAFAGVLARPIFRARGGPKSFVAGLSFLKTGLNVVKFEKSWRGVWGPRQ